MAQWITRLTTDQKIPGSNPGKIDTFSKEQLPILFYDGILANLFEIAVRKITRGPF